MTRAWANELDRAIDAAVPRLIELRRHLHQHPETSGQEYQTTAYLAQWLEPLGFRTWRGPDSRGLVVEPADGHRPPRVAVRADIDALCIQDAKQTLYRSTVPGKMHACGHDVHTATVVGVLVGLDALRAGGTLPWPVAWRGIFQPAEETSVGAKEMIAAGALEGIEAIFGLHVDPSRPVGRIGLRSGAFTAASDDLDIRLEGRGGHAARPHEAIDPIAAAAQFISSIYLFVPRGVDSQDPVVVTIGQVIAGDNPNVIPHEVRLRGTMRTLGGAIRDRTKDHIRKLARGIAESSDVRIAVEFKQGPGSVVNDRRLLELTRAAAADVVGPEQIDDIARPSMGAEDFAEYAQRVPGHMFRIGTRGENVGAAGLHTPEFDVDERALAIGAKILARSMIAWSDPSRIDLRRTS